MDGKVVDTANYTVKSGSTIITLKSSYLATLTVGKHILTVLYSDGQVSGDFEILKNSEVTTPGTDDNSNLMLWMALLFVSGAGLFGTTAYSRKKKYNK